MRSIVRFTLKSLGANRIRTLVTILGVALASALLTAVMTSYASLNSFLCEDEKAVSGAWMVEASSPDADMMRERIASAQENANVLSTAAFQDEGFGQLDKERRNILGYYLPIASYIGDIESLCAITPSEGRLPQTPDEIMLSTLWKTHDFANIGDKIKLDVGKRVAVKAAESADTDSQNTSGQYAEDDVRAPSSDIEAGDELDRSIGYLDADFDGGNLDEKLVDMESRTYTVVGFVEPYNYTLSTGVGNTALTGPESAGEGAIEAYLGIKGLDTMARIENLANQLFPDAELGFHTDLLRFMGIRGDSNIWDTFAGLVAVLAVIIIVACISLIYNAFAISVAERSSQFGLLGSIGASKRQLRRGVILEALIVAVIGIPLGILIGLAGCELTFAFIGPMITSVLAGGLVDFQTVIDGKSMALSAILTLATVLVSVLIPAIRVSGTSPIEALRSNRAGKISKRGLRDAAKSVSLDRIWRRGGFGAGIFGIAGQLAKINSKRMGSKGRAASVSLALAILLVMTAGSFNVFVGNLVDAADAGVEYDIGITAQLDPDKEEDDNAVGFFAGAYDALNDVEGAKGLGWYLDDTVPIVLEADMLDANYLKSEDEESGNAGVRGDGTVGMSAALFFLDDGQFDEFADLCGVNPKAYKDARHPSAIAINKAFSAINGTYSQMRMLNETGDVRILTGGVIDGEKIDGFDTYIGKDEDGNSIFEFVPYTFKEDVSEDLTDPYTEHPLDLNTIDTETLSIAHLTDEAPKTISQSDDTLKLVIPLSMMDHVIPHTEEMLFNAAFDVEGDAPSEVAERLEETMTSYGDAPQGGSLFSFVNATDFVEAYEVTHTLAVIVNVFCLLFTLILTLIAMANVFNTVTNGMILRRREFAVMRSIGLSYGQFRSMIARECLGYGLRGLVPGIVVSTIASYLLYSMVALSLKEFEFSLPWGYMGMALGLTLVTMVASVAYGMHRCKADNVVEALRTDNI